MKYIILFLILLPTFNSLLGQNSPVLGTPIAANYAIMKAKNPPPVSNSQKDSSKDDPNKIIAYCFPTDTIDTLWVVIHGGTCPGNLTNYFPEAYSSTSINGIQTLIPDIHPLGTTYYTALDANSLDISYYYPYLVNTHSIPPSSLFPFYFVPQGSNDSTYCKDTLTLFIYVSATPCNGNTITFQAKSSVNMPSVIADAGLDMAYNAANGASVTMYPGSISGNQTGTWSGGRGTWAGNIYTPDSCEIANFSIIPARWEVVDTTCNCSDIDEALITTLQVYSSGPLSFCSNMTITLSSNAIGSNYHYEWYFNNVIIHNNPTNQPSSPGNYILRVTDSLNEIDVYSLPINVTISQYVFADAGSDVATCPNTPAILTPIGIGTWSGGMGTFSGNQYTPDMSEAGSTVTLTWTVTGNAPCPNAIDIVNVTVSAIAPAPTISASSINVCAGTQVTLTAIPAAGYMAIEYLWYKDGVAVNWGYSPTYIVNAGNIAGNFSYSVEIVYAGYNCLSNNAVSISLNVFAPTVSITPSGPTTFCANTPTILNATAGYSSYVWKKSSLTVGTSATYTPSSTGNYKVTITDANGCTKTSSGISIVVKPIPIANAGPDKNLCQGASVQIGAGNNVANTYTWSPNTALNNFTISNPTTSATSTVTYTVTVTNTSTGCVNSDVMTLTSLLLPATPSLSGTTSPVCQGTSISITPTSSGAVSIYWYKNGTLLYIKPTYFVNYITAYSNSANTYTIKTKGANTCLSNPSNGISAWVKEAATPTITSLPAAVGNLIRVCVPNGTSGSATLNANSTTLLPTYSWKLAGAYIAGADSNAYIQTVTTASNNKVMTVEATYPNGCAKTSASKTVKLVTSGCTPRLDWGKDQADAILEMTDISPFIHIFPNPASDILQIEMENIQSPFVELVLYNTLGQAILQKNIQVLEGKAYQEIAISHITSGMYSLVITTEGIYEVRKIIKE